MKKTYESFKNEFDKQGLSKSFENCIAIVVQPGVEEKDAGCTEYDREKAKDLMKTIKNCLDEYWPREYYLFDNKTCESVYE